jgi:hypothetical protein
VTFLWLTTVISGKYAIPALWLLVVLPVGPLARGRGALLARAGLAGVTMLFHIDLAIMLSAAVAAYDLFGERDLPLSERLLRVAMLPLGAGLAYAGQTVVYAFLGMAPGELFRFLVLDRGGTEEGSNFAYPLFHMPDFRALIYPVTVIAPFVPLVWRRLSDPTRLVAFMHVALALIAIRKPDGGHIAAATVLISVLLVFAARDLFAREAPTLASPSGWVWRVVALLAGAGWSAGAIALGFTWPSLFAAAGLMLLCIGAALVARTGDHPWAGVGAGLTALVLIFGAVPSVLERVPDDDSDQRSAMTAAAAQPLVEDCLGPEREAWIVPLPPTMYDWLGISNPTPWYLFWAGFAQETDRVIGEVDAGEIPVIIQFNEWPPSFERLGPAIEDRYELCGETTVEGTGDRIRVWQHPSVP